MKLNTAVKSPRPRTHEGAEGPRLHAEDRLRRSVLACMLWEGEFYEDGKAIGERILELAREVRPEVVAALAVEARNRQHLRHAPLLLLSALAETGSGTSLLRNAIPQVVKRADELAELLAVYAHVKGVKPSNLKPVLTAQLKKGLARAFRRFDQYQLAKYDRAGAIRLRDVLFLTHAKPKDEEQAAVWAKLIDGTLDSPDTWEVKLSKAGAEAKAESKDAEEAAEKFKEDKAATFTRLLTEGRLGYMALLRNLHGMADAGVDVDLIENAILARRGAHRVLPFRFIAAARAAKQFEPVLDKALVATLREAPKWPGTTIVLVDVSDSMNWSKVSAKSTLTRMDAACALAAMVNAERKRVFSFSNRVEEVPPREGMALIDAIQGSQPHGGTWMGKAIKAVQQKPHDRLIVITDEQAHDRVGAPATGNSWLLNVASYERGVGTHQNWKRITGWSEHVLRYITEVERADRAD